MIINGIWLRMVNVCYGMVRKINKWNWCEKVWNIMSGIMYIYIDMLLDEWWIRKWCEKI